MQTKYQSYGEQDQHICNNQINGINSQTSKQTINQKNKQKQLNLCWKPTSQSNTIKMK